MQIMEVLRRHTELTVRSRCLIGGMKGKGKIVMVGKIGKKGKIGFY